MKTIIRLKKKYKEYLDDHKGGFWGAWSTVVMLCLLFVMYGVPRLEINQYKYKKINEMVKLHPEIKPFVKIFSKMTLSLIWNITRLRTSTNR